MSTSAPLDAVFLTRSVATRTTTAATRPMKWAVSMSLATQLSSHATTAVVSRQRGNAIQKTIAAMVQTKEVRLSTINFFNFLSITNDKFYL